MNEQKCETKNQVENEVQTELEGTSPDATTMLDNTTDGIAVACEEQSNDAPPTEKTDICQHCGAQLQEGQKFCPQCGQQIELADNTDDTDGTENNDAAGQPANGKKKHKRKKLIVILSSVAVLVLAATIVLITVLFSEPPVDKITLSQSSLTLQTDKSTTPLCTIEPEKSKDAKVTWKSSNESVATVNESGKITAHDEGSCTITAFAGEKTASLTVTVKNGPDFRLLYSTYCDQTYATVGYDGSYLSIDTNPLDLDDYSSSEAMAAIIGVNSALELPAYILSDMSSTTALMGRQSETVGKITVSWTFHPNRGLEVTYKAN